VEAFLTDLALRRNVSASTQNQALSTILFLYKAVLDQELDWIEDIVRAKRWGREPVVLSGDEVRALRAHLREPHHLRALLMYGAGLRLRECLPLQVKDIDFSYRQITVCDGKGGKDRVTVLPDFAVPGLERQIDGARALLAADEREGVQGVSLPYTLARKYPSAPFALGWQYVFPSRAAGGGRRRGPHRVHTERLRSDAGIESPLYPRIRHRAAPRLPGNEAITNRWLWQSEFGRRCAGGGRRAGASDADRRLPDRHAASSGKFRSPHASGSSPARPRSLPVRAGVTAPPTGHSRKGRRRAAEAPVGANLEESDQAQDGRADRTRRKRRAARRCPARAPRRGRGGGTFRGSLADHSESLLMFAEVHAGGRSDCFEGKSPVRSRARLSAGILRRI